MLNSYKWITVLLFVIAYTSVFAQETVTTISKDTINIRGYVYNYDGKPCKGAVVFSRSSDLIYNNTPISCSTNSEGYFELKGARFNDTLSFVFDLLSKMVPNNGSRYIVVKFPQPTVTHLGNMAHSTAERKHPHRTPSFNIKQRISDSIMACYVGQSAAFPGGFQKLATYIRKNLVYPQKAIDNNIEGDVEVTFTVDKGGSLKNIKVLKGLGYGCDEEAVQLMKNCPKWKPAIAYGHLLPEEFTLDVSFKLTN